MVVPVFKTQRGSRNERSGRSGSGETGEADVFPDFVNGYPCRRD